MPGASGRSLLYEQSFGQLSLFFDWWNGDFSRGRTVVLLQQLEASPCARADQGKASCGSACSQEGHSSLSPWQSSAQRARSQVTGALEGGRACHERCLSVVVIYITSVPVDDRY
jgi:hypothetical protein